MSWPSKPASRPKARKNRTKGAPRPRARVHLARQLGWRERARAYRARTKNDSERRRWITAGGGAETGMDGRDASGRNGRFERGQRRAMTTGTCDAGNSEVVGRGVDDRRRAPSTRGIRRSTRVLLGACTLHKGAEGARDGANKRCDACVQLGCQEARALGTAARAPRDEAGRALGSEIARNCRWFSPGAGQARQREGDIDRWGEKQPARDGGMSCIATTPRREKAGDERIGSDEMRTKGRAGIEAGLESTIIAHPSTGSRSSPSLWPLAIPVRAHFDTPAHAAASAFRYRSSAHRPPLLVARIGRTPDDSGRPGIKLRPEVSDTLRGAVMRAAPLAGLARHWDGVCTSLSSWFPARVHVPSRKCRTRAPANKHPASRRALMQPSLPSRGTTLHVMPTFCSTHRENARLLRVSRRPESSANSERGIDDLARVAKPARAPRLDVKGAFPGGRSPMIIIPSPRICITPSFNLPLDESAYTCAARPPASCSGGWHPVTHNSHAASSQPRAFTSPAPPDERLPGCSLGWGLGRVPVEFYTICAYHTFLQVPAARGPSASCELADFLQSLDHSKVAYLHTHRQCCLPLRGPLDSSTVNLLGQHTRRGVSLRRYERSSRSISTSLPINESFKSMTRTRWIWKVDTENHSREHTWAFVIDARVEGGAGPSAFTKGGHDHPAEWTIGYAIDASSTLEGKTYVSFPTLYKDGSLSLAAEVNVGGLAHSLDVESSPVAEYSARHPQPRRSTYQNIGPGGHLVSSNRAVRLEGYGLSQTEVSPTAFLQLCLETSIRLRQRQRLDETSVSHEIPARVGLDISDIGPGRNLRSLSLTCKTIHGVAVDELWKTLDSFVPLLKCLPDDAWHVDPESGLISVCRPLLPTDWARFQYYAPRVRSLFVGTDISAETLHDMCTYGRQYYEDLLPNLRKLSVSFSNVPFLACLQPLLNPDLRSLEFNDCGCKSLPTLSGLGDLLSLATPELNNLVLEMPSVKRMKTRYLYRRGALFSSPSPLQQLKTFAWDLPLTPADVIHLAMLPQLVDICLDLPANILDVQTLGATWSGCSAFPALRLLDVRGQTFSHCTMFLRFLGKHSLRAVILHAYNTSGDQEPIEIAEALKTLRENSCDPCLLESLAVRGQHHSPLRDALDYVLPFNTIRNLFVFRNMEYLLLDIPTTVDGDNDDLDELAQAWPRLFELQLGDYPDANDTRFTLRGLTSLARYCPSLSSLTIAINADLEHDNADLDGTWEDLGIGEDLYHLELAASSLRRPLPVARLLCRMFPNLRSVTGGGNRAAREVLEKYISEHWKTREEEEDADEAA
ncbi:hypothetical protein GLOTRDRAFT_93124 [Gloeophyllum trabeum ATCC 11539]|uniref:F-box domain-containing protein n=1 Tax=Gloeophyllum trabeum (strain ATCC 11539 / FP-39264 / Madison 617) TaxID=670483 RepID=S7RRD8_GLOTA|nr:uncharacterized protein GLOTRDRAFT_93124 [Gloeophyllum trabeum ATCC 11539]EPQ55489.1 hypothetical protein GLOTRDRAFT_93124 [Gloeophyllum trabeum ATCC 11539]